MFNKDYIMREIENLSRFLATVIFQKRTSAVEIIDEQGNISESGLLYHRLKALINENKINEAENLLFAEFEQDPNEHNLEVAIQFYKTLQELSDETLENANFSREEIIEGVESIKKILHEHQSLFEDDSL
jgi:predicted DNA-binding ArsR family transcriptional regulator